MLIINYRVISPALFFFLKTSQHEKFFLTLHCLFNCCFFSAEDSSFEPTFPLVQFGTVATVPNPVLWLFLPVTLSYLSVGHGDLSLEMAYFPWSSPTSLWDTEALGMTQWLFLSDPLRIFELGSAFTLIPHSWPCWGCLAVSCQLTVGYFGLLCIHVKSSQERADSFWPRSRQSKHLCLFGFWWEEASVWVACRQQQWLFVGNLT